MPVHNAEALLLVALDEALETLVAETPDVGVVYHLTVIPSIEYHSCEDDKPHLVQKLGWGLNLYFTFGGRFLNLHGLVPYGYCSDGDPEPLLAMLVDMWEDFLFAKMMLESGMDDELIAVEEEVNGAEGE